MSGILFVLVAMVLWGTGAIFSKLGVSALGPWSFTFVRSLFFFIVVVAIVFGTGKFQWSSKKNIIYPIGAGVAMGFSLVFFYNALEFYEVGYAKTILSFNIIVTVFLSSVFLREKLNLIKSIGLVLALGALVILYI